MSRSRRKRRARHRQAVLAGTRVGSETDEPPPAAMGEPMRAGERQAQDSGDDDEQGATGDTAVMLKRGTRQGQGERVADSPEPVSPPESRSRAGEEASSEELLLRAARQATANGEIVRAIGIYRELLQRAPANLKARNNLALLYERSGDTERAMQQFALCLEQDSQNCQVLINRGALLGTLARFQEAEDDLHAALRADAGAVDAHFNLGIVLSRKGRWQDALPYLRRTIELDSSRAAAYFYLGEALNHVDDLDGAMSAYQRAIELRPNDARALYGLGIVLDRMNRPDDATQMYRRSREVART